MSDGGKGSKQRPTDRLKFDQNFDRIFGKKDKLEEKQDDSRDTTVQGTK